MSSLNFFVLLTLFCWGIWGIADKKALNFASQEDVMVRHYLLTCFWIPVGYLALALSQPGWGISAEVMLWTGLACTASLIALLAYLAAMSITEASFVLGITAAYPLVMQVFASLILQEKLVFERFAGALIIGAGLFLISGSAFKARPGLLSKLLRVGSPGGRRMASPLQNQLGQASEVPETAGSNKEGPLSGRIIFYIVVATLTWGVAGLFDKKAVGCASTLVVFLAKRLWEFFFFFLLLFLYSMRKTKLNWRGKMSWLYCAFSVCALGVGSFTYIAALSMASASYVITITGCYPLLMYLFALWLLKEQFNKLRFAGILLVVVGGFLVQLTAGA